MAQFDRVYSAGKKNHFALAPKVVDQEKKAMSFILSTTGRKIKRTKDDSSDEDEDDDILGSDSIQADDIHLPTK